MTINKGSDNEIKISRWELSMIVGGITSAICSICSVINKKTKKDKE